MTNEGQGMKITFIGGGNMASALIGGLVAKGFDPRSIAVVELSAPARERLAAQYPVRVSTAPDAALQGADTLVLAVKPQDMRSALASLAAGVHGKLVISIAAGVTVDALSRWLGGHRKLVRCMPNTPALIGQGITGMAALPGVSPSQREAADAIMRAVGATVWLDDESLIDPVTAVSGSGPAYVFYFIEAMQQAAQELGLSMEQGTQLAIATFTGAAQLAAQSPDPVSVLRERVTSKGGTTYAALTSMEAAGVKEGIVRALHAAAERGRELGEEFGRD